VISNHFHQLSPKSSLQAFARFFTAGVLVAQDPQGSHKQRSRPSCSCKTTFPGEATPHYLLQTPENYFKFLIFLTWRYDCVMLKITEPKEQEIKEELSCHSVLPM
jgi:hypothetical protein